MLFCPPFPPPRNPQTAQDKEKSSGLGGMTLWGCRCQGGCGFFYSGGLERGVWAEVLAAWAIKIPFLAGSTW